MKTETAKNIYHLVKFVDDGVLYICSNARIKSRSGKHFVRYKNYGVWEANILASGDKYAMDKILSQYAQEDQEVAIASNDNKHIGASHLRMTEILNVGDVADLTENNNTLKCKRKLEFQHVKNIPEKYLLTCNQDKPGKSDQEDQVAIASNDNKHIGASHLRMTEILNVGDVVDMCDVDLLYSPVGNLTENNNTLECKRKLEFQQVKNIPEKNLLTCNQDKPGKSDQEDQEVAIASNDNKHLGASHLLMTEILNVGDVVDMCDVDLLYSPVRNLTENNNTLERKRKLEFQHVKNIPEKNLLTCNQDKPGQTGQENCFTTKIKEKSLRKRHFCPFCKKFQLAFGRHVLTIHKNEQIVQNILVLPKNSLQRKKELSLLRGKGMHMYNMENKEKNATLVVRNPKNSDRNTFVPCPNCTAYFLPRNLARHHKNCIQRPPNRVRVLKMASNLRNNVDNTLLNKLLSDLKQDDITEEIRSDKTLLLLASSISVKYAREKHLAGFMRQKLRQLSRLLITIKQIDHTVTDFKSCLIPLKYDIIREAVYKLCELNTETFTYKRPTMAAQLGSMLKDCVNVLKLDNIKKGLSDSAHQKHLDDFLLVHDKEYGSLIAKSALSTLSQNKWNKIQVLPSVEDIQIFQEYIKTKAEDSYNYLKSVGFKFDRWLCLARSCLLMLLTFNRRRVGEISRTLITNYENRQCISNEQLTTLNRLECILANTFERMEIRGKKGRRVPVLLTKTHINYIDMILKMRDKAGVPISNPFIFGVNSKGKYIDAGIVIREFSIKCGASNPDTLRGTHLRKHVATISQILNLNDNEIQQLADFMGHDVAIHRLHYRQPEISLQITKLAKFFMAAGETNMDQYKGKTLDELQTLHNDNQVNNKEDISSSDEDCDRPKKSTNLPSLNSDLVGTPRKRKYTFQSCSSLKSPVKRVPHTKVPWSKAEKNLIFKEFKHYFETKTLPSRLKCDALKQNYKKQLGRRTSDQIKALVNNINKKSI